MGRTCGSRHLSRSSHASGSTPGRWFPAKTWRRTRRRSGGYVARSASCIQPARPLPGLQRRAEVQDLVLPAGREADQTPVRRGGDVRGDGRAPAPPPSDPERRAGKGELVLREDVGERDNRAALLDRHQLAKVFDLHRASARSGVGLDRQHRALGVQQDPLRVAAQDQLADRRAAAQADHDQLGGAGLGDADQVLGGLEPADQLPEVVLDPGRVERLLTASISSSALRAAARSKSWPPRCELTTTTLAPRSFASSIAGRAPPHPQAWARSPRRRSPLTASSARRHRDRSVPPAPYRIPARGGSLWTSRARSRRNGQAATSCPPPDRPDTPARASRRCAERCWTSGPRSGGGCSRRSSTSACRESARLAYGPRRRADGPRPAHRRGRGAAAPDRHRPGRAPRVAHPDRRARPPRRRRRLAAGAPGRRTRRRACR